MRMIGLEINTIKEHREEVLNRTYSDKDDAVSVFLQGMERSHGYERMKAVAERGVDPEAEVSELTFQTKVKTIGNGLHILISMPNARKLGIGPDDDVEITIRKI